MESVTIKRTVKGAWMQRFDDYETGFKRIKKAEALDLIAKARENGSMFSDDNETKDGYPLVFGYWN